MRDLRIIEPRTTRIVEARARIENLAYDLQHYLKGNNYDNPDYEEINEITDRLCSVCEYIDDEALPIIQDRIEEEEAEEALLAAVN